MNNDVIWDVINLLFFRMHEKMILLCDFDINLHN